MSHADERLVNPLAEALRDHESTPADATDASRWFAEEVQPHEAVLRAVLSRLVASLSDVDDLVQECYLRTLRARERVPIRSPKAFLFTTARNAATRRAGSTDPSESSFSRRSSVGSRVSPCA